MARSQAIITNFTAGELSPRVLARVDVSRYQNGCEVVQNMVIQPPGGARRRGGWHYVSEVKDSSKKVRLVPFQFNVVQAFVLEFGDQYMRVFTNKGQVIHTVSTTSAWATNTAYNVADFVNNNGQVYRCILAHTSSSSDEPGVGVNWQTYWAQDDSYEIVSPYREADLPQLKWAQTGDIMYLAHPNYPLYKLTRKALTDWTLAKAAVVNGPFLDVNDDTSWTITPSATTGTVTLTASKDTWVSDHVGAYWYLRHSGVAGYVEITGYTDPRTVTAQVRQTLGGTTATSEWAEGAWSEVQGYPYAVCFFQERLFAVGSDGRPDSVWSSAVGDFEDFGIGTNDSDAVVYEILTNLVNVLLWVTPLQQALAVGSAGAEFTLRGAGDNQPITPTSVIAAQETAWGSADHQPINVSTDVLFMTRSKRKVRVLSPGFGVDRPSARDLTFIADHITTGGLVEMAYAQDPDSVLWCVRSDGVLVGATYEPLEEVLGWHQHPTDGKVESITVIPYGEESQLWACVQRTINGATKRYIEFLDPDLNTDSALTYSGSATSVVSGLDHLEGKTVKIRADGAEHPDRTVSGGQVTLDYRASAVEVGLRYLSKLRPVRLDVGNPAGTAQGRKKRWSEIFVRVDSSAYPTINGKVPPTRSGSDTMDQPPPLVTGDIKVHSLGWSRDGYITIESDRPLPLHVLGIFGTLEVEHGG